MKFESHKEKAQNKLRLLLNIVYINFQIEYPYPTIPQAAEDAEPVLHPSLGVGSGRHAAVGPRVARERVAEVRGAGARVREPLRPARPGQQPRLQEGA